MGFQNINLLDSVFLLVDYGKVLCYSPNKLQQKSNAFSKEEYIPQYRLFCSRFIVFTFDFCDQLSFVCRL